MEDFCRSAKGADAQHETIKELPKSLGSAPDNATVLRGFLKEVADVMDIQELQLSDVLESYPEWDSLSILSVIAMVGCKYGVNLTAREVRRAGTAKDLYDLVATKNELT